MAESAIAWLAVPCVCEFDGIVVYVYHRDHNPPHFHVRCGGKSAAFDIETLKLTEGSLPAARRRQVRAWAKSRQKELRASWELAAAHQPPGTIR